MIHRVSESILVGLTFAVVFVQGNNLVDGLFWRVALALRLLDFLGITALLDDEIEDVNHLVCCELSRRLGVRASSWRSCCGVADRGVGE